MALKFKQAKRFLSYWSKHYFDCFDPQCKTTLDLLKFQCYLEFSDNLLHDIRIIFQKSVDNYEVAHKTWGAVPVVQPTLSVRRGKVKEPSHLFKLGGSPNLLGSWRFFCLLTIFLTICFFFHMLDWMFTKLGQKHVWVYGYKTYGSKNSPGVIWGHRGQKR